MAARTADDIRGYEYDWIACDERGRLAVFCTAGGSYAPAAFLADIEAYDSALAAIGRQGATTVPIVAEAVAEGIVNPWVEFAVRGFYSYDGDASGGPYRLVGAPAVPVDVESVPASIAEVARRVRLGVEFGQMVISVEEIVGCARDQARR